jgi:hypothetical protein
MASDARATETNGMAGSPEIRVVLEASLLAPRFLKAYGLSCWFTIAPLLRLAKERCKQGE